jgi:hypothetical protein
MNDINIKQEFFVPGPLPSMNEIINASSTAFKNGIRFGSKYTKMKRDWDKKISEIILASNIKPVDQFMLELDWSEKTRRKDPDNIAVGIKFILDSMVKCKVIPNDTWRYNLGWTNTFNISSTPGVRVVIIPADTTS